MITPCADSWAVLTILTAFPVNATPARVTSAAARRSHGPPQPIMFGGQPPVLRMQLGLLHMPGPCGFCVGPTTAQFADEMRLLFAHAFVGAGDSPGSPAQQAVQAALLQGAGVQFAAQPGVIAIADNFPGPAPQAATAPVYAAARRLATLPTAAQHAWLAAHLAALRADRLTLEELP